MNLCQDELNVREVRFTEDARAFTTYQLKPQMRTLGPRYGKLLKAIGETLAAADGNEVVDAFERGETVHFTVNGTDVELSKDDVLTSPMQKPGFMAQEDRGVTVVLDTNLTPALISEGFAREVISKIQTQRKDSGFEVTDRIQICMECSDKLWDAVTENQDMILRATLGLSLERGACPEDWKRAEWNVNGEDAVIGLKQQA